MTEFCPQTDSLTVGSFRGWNGLTGRHGYDFVRVSPSHRRSAEVNRRLRSLEADHTEGDLEPAGDGP